MWAGQSVRVAKTFVIGRGEGALLLAQHLQLFHYANWGQEMEVKRNWRSHDRLVHFNTATGVNHIPKLLMQFKRNNFEIIITKYRGDSIFAGVFSAAPSETNHRSKEIRISASRYFNHVSANGGSSITDCLKVQ